MVSKCANPACSTTFRYLYDGRLFHLPVGSPAGQDPHGAHPLESFWLCGQCCRKMTLVAGPAGVSVVPLSDQSGQEKPKHSSAKTGGFSDKFLIAQSY